MAKKENTDNNDPKKAPAKKSQRRNALGRGLGALLTGDDAEPVAIDQEDQENQEEGSTEQASAEPKKETKRKTSDSKASKSPSAERQPAGNKPTNKKAKAAPPTGVAEVPIDTIEPNPYQPRVHFDEAALEELADSIQSQGVIQPITVREIEPGQYQLIAGERRWRASQMIGLTQIPAFVRKANDEQMMAMALIENLQRDDLNPIETALAYQRLIDEFGLVIQEVGKRVGKKRSTVNNYLRLLKLPPEVQKALREKRISMGHARALINIDKPEALITIFNDVLKNGLSVRKVEELARQLNEPAPTKSVEDELSEKYKIQLKSVEKELETKYGTRTQITHDSRGGGEIKLKYFSKDDLNRLLELLT